MIVVDANVLLYRWIPGDKTATAQRVSQVDADWIVPPIWRLEFANAIAVAVLRRAVTRHAGLGVLEDATTLLGPRERVVPILETASCAMAHSISAYDAEYVVLALNRGVKLVTENRELHRKFPETALPMQRFLALEDRGDGFSMAREKKSVYKTRRRTGNAATAGHR